MKTLKRNVVIIPCFGLPNGMANTNRVMNMASGLSRNGVNVEVIVPKPTEVSQNPLNNALSGEVEHFTFRYTSDSTILSDNYIARKLQIIVGFTNCVCLLIQKRKEIRAAILYLRDITSVFVIAGVCRLLKIKAIMELCEWPISFEDLSVRERIGKLLFIKYSFHFVDGLVAISSFLSEKVKEFEKRHRKERPQVIIPILVNWKKFDSEKKYNPKGNLLFSGIWDQLEIMKFLLEVMRKLINMGVQRKLIVLGKANKKENFRYVSEMINRLKLEEFVILKGFVSNEELREQYWDASVLLAPLTASDRSVARFPSKIGEYLSTGRPVITNRIGDIPNYLVDGESAILVHPGDSGTFAKAIVNVLDDPCKAEVVGRRGKEVARFCFDPGLEGIKLTNFIDKICLEK